MRFATHPGNTAGTLKHTIYILCLLSLGLLAFTHTAFAADTDNSMIRFVGNFSNMKITGGKYYGSQIVLWQYKNTVVGMYYNANGQTGDLPRGVIDNVKLNPKSGNLSFDAKLTTGLHSCEVHTKVPSQDLFSFTGVLRRNTLKGHLTQKDTLHDTVVFHNAKINLKHEIQPHFDSFDSMEAWQAYVDAQLKQYGPKW